MSEPRGGHRARAGAAGRLRARGRRRAGRVVYLGGQTALAPDGTIAGETLAEQFDVAAGNVVAALRAAGCTPEDMVSLQIFVTDVEEYRGALEELAPCGGGTSGAAIRPRALFGVVRLFDVEAKIELMAVAVRPEP